MLNATVGINGLMNTLEYGTCSAWGGFVVKAGNLLDLLKVEEEEIFDWENNSDLIRNSCPRD